MQVLTSLFNLTGLGPLQTPLSDLKHAAVNWTVILNHSLSLFWNFFIYNTQKQINTQPIMESKENYKSNWENNIFQMPHSIIPFQIFCY
jgi:hypothetical protein